MPLRLRLFANGKRLSDRSTMLLEQHNALHNGKQSHRKVTAMAKTVDVQTHYTARVIIERVDIVTELDYQSSVPGPGAKHERKVTEEFSTVIKCNTAKKVCVRVSEVMGVIYGE